MISRALAAICAALAALALTWGLARDRAADRAEDALLEARAAQLVAEAQAKAAQRRADLATFNAGVAHLALEDAERERASTAYMLDEWRKAYVEALDDSAPDALRDLARRMQRDAPGADPGPGGNPAAD